MTLPEETKGHFHWSKVVPLAVLALVFGVAISFFVLQLYHLLHPVIAE